MCATRITRTITSVCVLCAYCFFLKYVKNKIITKLIELKDVLCNKLI